MHINVKFIKKERVISHRCNPHAVQRIILHIIIWHAEETHKVITIFLNRMNIIVANVMLMFWASDVQFYATFLSLKYNSKLIVTYMSIRINNHCTVKLIKLFRNDD